MARLIPAVDIDEIEVKPERDVARALVEQLPDDVRVFHSYPWLRPDRNDRTGKTTLQEGETDFLILWPAMGLLVLEVKGGDIRYEADARRWYRRLDNGREREIKDPFEQASRNMHEIVARLSEQEYLRKNPPFMFGYAVVFPDCHYAGPMPPGADPAICLSAGDLHQMEKRLKRAGMSWSRQEPPLGIGKTEMDKVMRVVLPQFRILPVLFRNIEEQEEALFRLTEDQTRLLDFLGRNKRALIEGVAGSGKTMLARAQAQKFADRGMKTLLVCYNKSLAGWLREAVPESYRDLIHVHHFHGLSHDWCRRAGIAFNPNAGDAGGFWAHEAAELFWQAIEGSDERYDAVVVDEGQDFMPDWWQPLELINRDGDQGHLYVFYDPAQNLYNDDGVSLPALGDPFELPMNCRNTRAIATMAGNVLHREIQTHPRAPQGAEPEIVVEGERPEVVKLLNGWVKTWVKKEGIRPSQIAIISPFKKRNSCLRERAHFAGVSLTESLDRWEDGEGMLFSTIRSFKGLEADIVVIVDVIEPDTIKTFSRADLYVACSRAKHVLKIVSKVEPERLFRQEAGTDG